MVSSIDDPVARARVIELDARASLAANRVTEREARLADLRERQAQLQRRLIAEQDGRPEDLAGEELADALVVDPEAELSAGARTALRTARDKSARVIADHEAATSVTATAIAKVERLISEVEAELETDRTAAADAWRDFVLGAYEAVLDEVRGLTRYLVEGGSLGVLVALSEVRELNSMARIVSGSHPRLGEESKIVLRTHGVPMTTETLFNPSAGPGHPGSIDRSAVLETFRARLCADALAERAQ